MRKTEHMPYGKARAHHAADNKQSRHHSRPSGIHKLFEAEFQTEREKQHHNAQLGPEFDIILCGYRRQIFKIRAGKKSRYYITENHRLFKPLEQKGGYSTEYKQKGQIADQALYIESLSHLCGIGKNKIQ